MDTALIRTETICGSVLVVESRLLPARNRLTSVDAWGRAQPKLPCGPLSSTCGRQKHEAAADSPCLVQGPDRLKPYGS